MGNTSEKESPVVETVSENKPEEKKKLKACCACPDTKRVRDECILLKGEENCKIQIEAHKQCMRELGFNI